MGAGARLKFDSILMCVELAGAEGFEPSPSTLTVWCPTGWTTPQQHFPSTYRRTNRVGSAAQDAAKGFSKIPRSSPDSGMPSRGKNEFAALKPNWTGTTSGIL